MENVKCIGTPISSIYKFDKDEHENNMDPKTYQGTTRLLHHLTTNRPNITFRVYLYTTYQSNLKEFYVMAIKGYLDI